MSPVVTSKVYPEPKEWWEMAFLIPHEAVRRLLTSGTQIAEKLDPAAKPWQVELFQKWYRDFYYKFIHSHHDIEEQVYFPGLAKKAELPPRYTTDHVALVEMLEKVLTLSSKLSEDPTSVTEISQVLGKIHDTMNEHMDEEEREIAGVILKDNFTPKEDEALTSEVLSYIQKTGDAAFDIAVVYSAMLEWMTDEQLKDFLNKKLPMPVRLLLKKCWYPKLLKNEKQWSVDLLGDEEPKKPPAGCACTIM